MEKRSSQKMLQMVQTAILAAIVIIMSFTPLGFLKVGPLSITFITIPVVIGAIIVGPTAGAFLGGVFGACSFIQCLGMDAMGVALMAISPVKTFIMCMAPRILMGWLVALIFRAIAKKQETAAVVVASVAGPLINTALFMGALLGFFHNAEYMQQFGDSVWVMLTTLVTVNVVAEAASTLVVGTAVSKALLKLLRR